MLNQKAYTILEQFFYSGLNRLQISTIVKNTKYDFKTVKKYLDKFLKLGIVKRYDDYSVPIYEAGYRNKYFLNLKKQKMLDDIFLSNLPSFLNEKFGKTGCLLFGSCGRGDYYEDSDIDLFIQSKQIKLDFKKFEKKLNKKINLFFEEKWQNLTEGLQTGLLNDGIAINGRLKI